MANLKRTNLSKTSNKYLFKDKLGFRRKSKNKLLAESLLMFSLATVIVYLNYLIPNKSSLFRNLVINFEKTFIIIIDLFVSLYQILLVIFIVISLIFALILFIGSFSRLLKLIKIKTRNIFY